jgi:hypothetical protein
MHDSSFEMYAYLYVQYLMLNVRREGVQYRISRCKFDFRLFLMVQKAHLFIRRCDLPLSFLLIPCLPKPRPLHACKYPTYHGRALVILY